ncbi:MAG: glycosyltransferase family 9 protein [Phycisphaeraceae bacterium]
MKHRSEDIPLRRVLVIMPRLLGESVMATAVLHALKQSRPELHVTALIKRRLRPVLFGLDSVDRVLSIRKRRRGPEGKGPKGRTSLIRLGRRLSKGNFDTAIIMPHSFKAAALPTLAGIPRRVGYEREGRGVLLTDRLVRRRNRGEKDRGTTIDSYMSFARYLGAKPGPPTMQQAIQPEATQRLDAMLDALGCDPSKQELLLINPGAPTPARRWSPRRMAHLCELMTERFGVTPVVTGTPAERPVVEEVLERATVPILDLPQLGRDLHLLKAMVARSRMMVTNDAGPRFLAAAMGVPLLTLFGPTSPQGSALYLLNEQQVVADGLSVAAKNDPAFDGPASLDRLHADEVFEQAALLYEQTRSMQVEARP